MSVPFAPRHLSAPDVSNPRTLVIAATACLALLCPTLGFAESGATPAQRAQAVGETQAFNIPAGPLAVSLNALSRAAGFTFAVDPAQVAGKTAPALSGTFTPQQALERLLAGSGLIYRFTDASTVTLTQAAVQDSGGPLTLDPVVVQGELQTRTLQETQTSVTVVTGEELETRSDTSLRSIAERTAGVSTSARGVGFVIRGVDERGVDANGPATPTISTSVDGLRITDFGRISTTFLPTWDLEQVEILRGPQSTQSGRNALAGAVVVRSKDPTYDQELKLRGGLGNFETRQGAIALNQPIVQDKLAVRLSGEINRTDGFVENITTGSDEEGRTDNRTLRASLRFDPSDDLWSVLKLSYIDSFDGFPVSDNDFLPDRIDDRDAKTREDAQYRSANLRFGYALSDAISFENETVYTNRDFLFSFDPDGGPASIATFDDDVEGESVSQELRVIYDTERTQAVVGGFFTRIEEKNVDQLVVLSNIFAPPAVWPFLTPGSTQTSSSSGRFTVRNWALFGEIDFEVIDNVRLIVGARYDNESRETENVTRRSTNDPALAPFLQDDPTVSTSTNFDAFLPKAGIVYEFTDDVSLGFTYQRGYRAGGAGFNSARREQFTFDPEFTNNYELAFRSQWLDNRLTINANAYFVGYKDQQLVVELSNQMFDFQTENAGSSQSYGTELDVRAVPFDNLDVFASIGYNRTEFEDFVSNGVQLAGNEFRNAPRWTGSVGGTYYFDNGAYFGTDASYTSRSFADAANTSSLRSDSRFLVNARAGFEADNFNVFLYANNIFDNDYVEERGTVLSTLGPPRTFGIIGQLQF
ncbi:MAG: TonB-dependent receptor domain-containing protein [Kiloniellales bacterium]